jgi:hypothetical protein
LRNTLLAALILSVAILGVFHYSNLRDIRKAQRQIEDLNNKLDAMSKTVSLDVQEKCAKQALEEFRREGYATHPYADFSDHYNPKFNKCFMEIEDTQSSSTKGEILSSRALSDAFEGKVYGNYIFSTQKGKKFWEVPPLDCYVLKQSGEQEHCHSFEEYQSLAKQYLE